MQLGTRRPPKSEARCRCSRTRTCGLRRTNRPAAGAAVPGRVRSPDVPLLLRGRQRQRHQRLRAARRPDVREPRHDRRRPRRGRGGGVMAHELSHVVLRHGTAQASKAQPYEIGRAGRRRHRRDRRGHGGQRHLAGHAVRPGRGVPPLQPGVQKQADILGAQIMAARRLQPARDGHDVPDHPAGRRFRGPQWLSGHPDPGNRSAYILAEAKHAPGGEPGARHRRAPVGAGRPAPDAGRAPTTEQILKNAERNGTNAGDAGGQGGRRARAGACRRTCRSRRRASAPTATDPGASGSASPRTGGRCRARAAWCGLPPRARTPTRAAQEAFTHGIELGIAQTAAPTCARHRPAGAGAGAGQPAAANRRPADAGRVRRPGRAAGPAGATCRKPPATARRSS